jgi:hypothetical protein
MQASQHSGKYAKLNSKFPPPSPPTFPPLLAREGFTDFTNIPLERCWQLFTPLWWYSPLSDCLQISLCSKGIMLINLLTSSCLCVQLVRTPQNTSSWTMFRS